MTTTQHQGSQVDAPESDQDELRRLSTAPEPVASSTARRRQTGPSRSGRAGLRRAWRQLTSMRTALLLLFLLALASVPGGFLPQRPTSPARVQEYLTDHRVLGPVLDRLQMFDVFASSWFATSSSPISMCSGRITCDRNVR